MERTRRQREAPSSRPDSVLSLAAPASARAWARRHAQSAVASLGDLFRAPLATGLTVAVIAIALALPGGLYLAVVGAAQVAERWDRGAQIAVFLRSSIADDEAVALGRRLERLGGVAGVRVLDRAAALRELETVTGMPGFEAAFAGANPLPTVLIVAARGRVSDPSARASIEGLVAELRAEPAVEFVEFGTRWLGRLQAILGLAQRAIAIVGALLGLGLLLAVGNTIRLAFDAQRETVVIARLCGATDAFIRRPFLYAGAWYGLLGGVGAWLLLALVMALLKPAFGRLLALYPGESLVLGTGPGELVALASLGGAIGLGGAWIAVRAQLRRLPP